MVLSNLTINDLSRALSVLKQWTGTILDTPQLRRTLFLEAEQPKEYLRFMRGRDQRCYEVLHAVQPVIVYGLEASPAVNRVIVEPHPALLGRVCGRKAGSTSDINIDLPDYGILTSVPASALLFQPPLDTVTIGYWARHTHIQIPGGVTFGAILQEVEKKQTAAKEAAACSPRFGGYLFRVADRLSLPVRADEAVVNDWQYVKEARRAIVKGKEFAVLDELEEKST